MELIERCYRISYEELAGLLKVEGSISCVADLHKELWITVESKKEA